MNTNKSKEIFEEAKKSIPGGVNSPVRAFQSVKKDYPIFIESAKGSKLFDEDGNEYIDMIGSWGPMILGHNYPEVLEVVKSEMEKGTSFGLPTKKEVVLAELVKECFPAIEKIRLTTSGTEATMAAVRLARAFTKKNKILKFEGCYHGHSDSLLVKAGSGLLTFEHQDSNGITEAVTRDTITTPFGDFEKVKQLDELVTQKAGFGKKQGVSGQTYDRKVDAQILNLLSNIAQSSHKFTNDFRLLQHLKELEEPFEKNQIGSSAMAYKRNPMRSERISSLAKYVISSSQTGALVFATQWFERTLDDSASKRLSIPQAFLAVDAILIIWLNIMDGVVVYPKVIEANIQKELPFMATENIIMESVKKGMDRQEVHEIIRELSMEETKEIKLNGNPNRLIDRIIKDGRLGLKAEDMEGILVSANYTGFAGQQTEDFVKNEINPILDKYKDEIVEDREELRV